MVTVIDRDTDEFRAIIGHVVGFTLPFLGPALLLLASRRRGQFVCQHLVEAMAASLAWLILAVVVISVDVGHLSLDEQQTSTAGRTALLALAAAVIAVIVTNIQRAKRQQPPLGFSARRK